MSKNAKVSGKVSISSKIEQLQELTNWFESDEFDLEQALKKYQQAAALAKEVEKELTEMKNQIKIVQNAFVSGEDVIK